MKHTDDREQWRDVAGYEGRYSVSSLGRVRSEGHAPNSPPGMILKASCRSGGYVTVTLYSGSNDSGRTFNVHTLVAEAFLGPRPKDAQVNHIDGNKENNAAANLEYVSPSGNMQHAHEEGLASLPPDRKRLRGENHPAAKLSREDVIDIKRRLADGEGCATLAAEHEVSEATIRSIDAGRTWSHVQAE